MGSDQGLGFSVWGLFVIHQILVPMVYGVGLRFECSVFRGWGFGSEAGSYLRFIDSCITQLRAQGPARTCNKSKEEEEGWGVGYRTAHLLIEFRPVLRKHPPGSGVLVQESWFRILVQDFEVWVQVLGIEGLGFRV